jgi:hypothetical protein
MHNLIFPSADTYLSNHSQELLVNYGANQTLAVDCSYIHNTVLLQDKTKRRTLLKFDLSSISQSLASNSINNVNFILKMKVSQVLGISATYSVYCYPVSQSWEQGTGMFAYDGNEEGVNWVYRNYPNTSSIWFPDIDTTSSINYDYLNNPGTASFIAGGGTWYYQSPSTFSSSFYQISSGSNLFCTQSFSYQTADINLDVTNICKAWMCGVVPNEGFILVSSAELFADESDGGELQFFGNDTNTVYSPCIDVKYDDSTFSTGSLSPVTASVGVYVSVVNYKPTYKSDSIVRFDVFARDLYPRKNFDRLQDLYLTAKYLPSSSYYSIVDNHRRDTIIPFDSCSKLSLDGTVNYFNLNMAGLQAERYYRILLKICYADGTVSIVDNGIVFKVEK